MAFSWQRGVPDGAGLMQAGGRSCRFF